LERCPQSGATALAVGGRKCCFRWRLAQVELDGYTVIADKRLAGEEFEQGVAVLSPRFLRPYP
jgi:hypothetical protein